MLGKVSIEVSEHGYGVNCDLSGVDIPGKIELMHVLATSLDMSNEDLQLFMLTEAMGVLKDAETPGKMHYT